MVVVENSLRSKYLYKIVLYLIKVTPIVISVAYLLNTILSYFYIDLPIISYLTGVSLVTILFLYATSVTFRFCFYHRIFIHYISLNWILDAIDYNIGIQISNRSLFLVYIIITGIFLLIILYGHCKKNSIKIIKRNS